MLPGEPDSTGREITAVEFVERALQLVTAFTDSLRDANLASLHLAASPEPPRTSSSPTIAAVQRGVLAAMLTVADPQLRKGPPAEILKRAVDAIRDVIDYENRPDHKRS
jgi:hypothetical protein